MQVSLFFPISVSGTFTEARLVKKKSRSANASTLFRANLKTVLGDRIGLLRVVCVGVKAH